MEHSKPALALSSALASSAPGVSSSPAPALPLSSPSSVSASDSSSDSDSAAAAASVAVPPCSPPNPPSTAPALPSSSFPSPPPPVPASFAPAKKTEMGVVPSQRPQPTWRPHSLIPAPIPLAASAAADLTGLFLALFSAFLTALPYTLSALTSCGGIMRNRVFRDLPGRDEELRRCCDTFLTMLGLLLEPRA